MQNEPAGGHVRCEWLDRSRQAVTGILVKQYAGSTFNEMCVASRYALLVTRRIKGKQASKGTQTMISLSKYGN